MQRTRYLRSSPDITDNPARQNEGFAMGAHLLAGIPFATTRKIENGDLNLAIFDRGAPIHGEVFQLPHGNPLCFLKPVLFMLFEGPAIQHANLFQRDHFRGPIPGSLLSAFDDHFDHGFRFLSIHKLTESFAFFRILNDDFPFTFVSVYHRLHHLFEFGADAKLILDNGLPQMVDPPLQVVQPDGCPRKTFGRSDVVHQEAVDISKSRFLIEIRSQ